MSYFPFFMDLEGKNGLIVGGGTVALRKIEKLLPYGPRLTVVAPAILPEIRELPGLELRQRAVPPRDLTGVFFVVAATGDPALNHAIAGRCQRKKILVNVVDDREYCTFLFPALVKSGPLSVGISSGGASPTAAIHLKNQVADLLPPNFPEILQALEEFRERVKAAIPQEARRAQVFSALFLLSMERRRPLTEPELQSFLAQWA